MLEKSIWQENKTKIRKQLKLNRAKTKNKFKKRILIEPARVPSETLSNRTRFEAM